MWGSWQDGEDGKPSEAVLAGLRDAVLLASQSRTAVPWVTPGGHEVAVEPQAVGSHGNRTLAVLASSYGKCLIWDGASAQNRWPSVWLEITGVPCLRHGGSECVAAWRDALADIGFTESRNKIRRLDYAVDVPGQSIRPFYDAWMQRRYVSRGKPDAYGLIESGWTGYLGNQKTLLLRVYDKKKQALANETKVRGYAREVARRRWGFEGGDPDWHTFEAVRAEAKMMGEWLKKGTKAFSVVTWEDWCNHRGKVLDYVFVGWCDLRTEAPDRAGRNYKKGETMKEWERVRQIALESVGPDVVAVSMPWLKQEASKGHAMKASYSMAVGEFVREYGGAVDELDRREVGLRLWRLMMRMYDDRDESGSELERIKRLIRVHRSKVGIQEEPGNVPF